MFVEGAWEVLENTPLIIGRYREVTASLGYDGDSIVNSFGDGVAMLVGFLLAARAAVWVSCSPCTGWRRWRPG